MKWIHLLVLRPLSRLPYSVLYAVAAILSFLALRIGGYRRSVIRTNLRLSFPKATAEELGTIERGFRKHFGELVVETIKHFTVSEERLIPRMHYFGTDALDRLHDEGRHVVIAGGHLNNWELYAVTANRPLKHQVTAIYKRLSDPHMDRVMRSSRERFGLKMIATTSAKEWGADALKPRAATKQAVVFGFDQSPADPKKSWWTLFLNQETAWYWGLEQFARLHNMPVVFGHITKLKRGHYACRYELVTDAPRDLPEGEVLRRCIDLLEADIQSEPAHWLWTHKRWKHRRPEGIPLNPRTP
jgi:Kdo2-lipid IVA lauroyltransferase/acyltransferase